MEKVIAELVLGGIVKIGVAVARNASIKEDLQRMTGAVESLRSKVIGLDETLDKMVENSLNATDLVLKENMLKAMGNLILDDNIRSRMLPLALAIYATLNKTETTQVNMKIFTLAYGEVQTPGRSTASDTEGRSAIFYKTSSCKEIVQELNNLQDFGIFSSVKYQSRNEFFRLSLDVFAEGANDRNHLSFATGAVYKLSQILCESIQDSRGVEVHASEDGLIARKQSNPFHSHKDSFQIAMRYYWPSPHRMAILRTLEKDGKKNEKIYKLMKSKVEKRSEVKRSVKNLYLLGETGEGKSTLANVLTGTENFPVSHAGTGTFKISGMMVQAGGKLQVEGDVMVWDTPGMNDEGRRDRYYEYLLRNHITKEFMVSSIVVVSKDGCRVPNTLQETLRTFKNVFGESFGICLSVCIGLFMEEECIEAIESKRKLWTSTMSALLGTEFTGERVFFYNAKRTDVQTELGRFCGVVSGSGIHMTGIGNTILQELSKFNDTEDKVESRKRMLSASKPIYELLKSEALEAPRLIITFPKTSKKDRNSDSYKSIEIVMKPSIRETFECALSNEMVERFKGSRDDVQFSIKEIKLVAKDEASVRCLNQAQELVSLHGRRMALLALYKMALNRNLVIGLLDSAMVEKKAFFMKTTAPLLTFELVDVKDRINQELVDRVRNLLLKMESDYDLYIAMVRDMDTEFDNESTD